MKLIAFLLIVASGIVLSFDLLKEEKKKLSELEKGKFLSDKLRSEIENYKTPIDRILEELRAGTDFGLSLTPEELPDFFGQLCKDGKKARELTRGLMEKNYEGAVTSAKKLSEYLGEAYAERQKEFELKKTARTVIPTAIGLLAGILII